HHLSTSVIPTLSLHDALPICFLPNPICLILGDLLNSNRNFLCPSLISEGTSSSTEMPSSSPGKVALNNASALVEANTTVPKSSADRKSTRLNSSHEWNSYAVY